MFIFKKLFIKNIELLYHIHALAIYGAVDRSGNFYKLDSVNTDWLSTVFARNLFDALVKEELLDQDTVNSMLSWQHSGFNVWVGDPVKYSDADSVKFLARYLKKAPVSNQRIEFLEDLNTVRYIKYTDSGKEHRDFDPLHLLYRQITTKNLIGYLPNIVRQSYYLLFKILF